MTTPTTGRCFCGDVTYEIRGEPVLSLLCFCSDCLAISGTDGYAGLMVQEADFNQLSGKTSVHSKLGKSGRTVHRHFCPTCGSNLWGHTELGLISVAAGSLDNPALFMPTRAVFTNDAPAWARIPAGLPREG